MAAEAPHYEERETISPYAWRWLGEPLDPSLRAACIDTLLGLADRYSCWGALGEVAACFPPSKQRLALVGLCRLADPPRLDAPEWVAEALGRVEAEAGAATAAETSAAPADADDGAWSDADAAKLAALNREVERRVRRVGGSDGGYMLRRCCSELTLPAAALSRWPARSPTRIYAPSYGPSWSRRRRWRSRRCPVSRGPRSPRR